MNRENLKKIADFILTIPQEMFDMSTYREGQEYHVECNSVGCILGHSVILDHNSENIPRNSRSNNINFDLWSVQFTGLIPYSDKWCWCFSVDWCSKDNTPEGASKRINWLLDHGLPRDWEYQMEDMRIPLCYL